jgi:hypothetical protein
MSTRRTIATVFAAASAMGAIALAATTTGVLAAATPSADIGGAGPDFSIEVSSVVDGGFESTHDDGEGPDISTWQYHDSEWGYVACVKTSDWCGSNRSDIGPHTGAGWALFGDSTSPAHTAQLSQKVTVPVGATELTYYYRNAGVDAPYNAILNVKVDGEVVNFHQEGTAASAEYAKYGAYIAQFADGGEHELSFEYDGGSASTSGLGVNIMEIDDVEIITAH